MRNSWRPFDYAVRGDVGAVEYQYRREKDVELRCSLSFEVKEKTAGRLPIKLSYSLRNPD
jgi:hypothetical protein